MEDSFVGRSRELAYLNAAWSGERGALVPVYGRRRIGKSQLILEFLRGKPGVYFAGQQSPAALQLGEFLAAAATALGAPVLASLAPRGWREALESVVAAHVGPGRLVIALDEFQWAVEASPELPSVLQSLWDRSWQHSGRVMLVLCGSYVGFMEREVLGSKSPLFGRRSGQIHLQPFSAREARFFHPGWSLVEVARARFVCGGVPWYLRNFDPARSFTQNLRDTLLDEHAPLYREPEFLVREELRDVHKYAAVLASLARGSATPAELAARAGVPPQSVAYYLNTLTELGYVSRRVPLSGAPPSRRVVRWRISDPLLRFWYRFVFPRHSTIRQLGADRALAELVLPDLPAWEGVAFEDLCREALPLIYEEEGMKLGAEVGEYWDREVQVDVVAARGDGWIDLGECRWGATGSRAAVVDGLRAKLARVPNPRGATVGLRVFAREAIPEAQARALGVRWHGLRAIYGE